MIPSDPVAELLRLLPTRTSVDRDLLDALSRDSSRAEPAGLPAVAVAARTVDDVSTTLAWASRRRVRVSIRGAGTGLAGGAVGFPDGVVLSTAAMDDIGPVDVENRLVTVGPGAITANVDQAAAAHGLMYAPDPASFRDSTIGGNIATNAGGLRCVKYGVTADHVAGLEVVLADGRVVRTGSQTRKDVVGFDLTRLFVGSEGTLGVVTEATLRLVPRPVGNPATVRATFAELPHSGTAVARIMAGPVVPEVMELMDRTSVRIVEQFHPTGLRTDGAAVLVVQTTGPNAAADAETVARQCRAAGAVDVEIAADDVLLEARRASGPALDARGLRLSCDVAVPVSRLAEMFTRIESIASRTSHTVATFAHAGDGNLHPSVLVDDETPTTVAAAEEVLELITDAALELGGTLSGEHGVGSLKLPYLPRQLSPETLDLHRTIRAALDPSGILSPGRAI